MWSNHANRILPLTLNIFVCLYLLFTLSHVFVVDDTDRSPLILTATLTAVIAAALRGAVKQSAIIANAEKVLVLLIALGAFNSLLHLLITGDIIQSTNLIFVIAACGFLVMNTWWFVGLTAVTLLLWSVAAAMLADPTTVHFAYALLMGTVMAGLLHYLQRQSVQTEAALSGVQVIGQATLIVDSDDVISDCNDAAADLIGGTADEITGRSIADILTLSTDGTTAELTRENTSQAVRVTRVSLPDTDEVTLLIFRR